MERSVGRPPKLIFPHHAEFCKNTAHKYFACFFCRVKQADEAGSRKRIEAWVLSRETERVNSARPRLCLRASLSCFRPARAGTLLGESSFNGLPEQLQRERDRVGVRNLSQLSSRTRRGDIVLPVRDRAGSAQPKPTSSLGEVVVSLRAGTSPPQSAAAIGSAATTIAPPARQGLHALAYWSHWAYPACALPARGLLRVEGAT
jgi:hypothetical protein